MKKGKNKLWGSATLSVMIAALLAVTAFALLTNADVNENENTTLGAAGDYNVDDIAVINAIILYNELAWTTCPYTSGDPSTEPTWVMGTEWAGVTWSSASTDKRITSLIINSKSLTGTLDISGLTALKTLNCANNNLTALDVSGCTVLETLVCTSNKLTELDVSELTALTSLGCHDNSLTALDVSSNTVLKTLTCSSNKLTALDVSNNTLLALLECSINNLTELDVSNNTLLETLSCFDNKLTVLDVSYNTELNELGCDGNELTSLDVSGLNEITYLNVRNNYFTDETKVVGADALTYFIAAGGWDVAGEYFFFSPQKYVFTNSESFNIPAGQTGEDITPVNVYDGVFGGEKPYKFSIDGPEWLLIDEDTGVITGKRPASAETATTATVGVT
ncbi:MAG: hypothetical protein FWH44_03490, partial [Methanomassiliicoccaceae archaeon]|nr:hypothetical protein [Methanomassiliicoccaceae archaeon]